MVLIAIDKHSRKILGYLCKNNQTVAYCCGDCDVEFTTAFDLEQHMVTHEQKTPEAEIEAVSQVADVKSPDEVLSDFEMPSKQLNSVEHENFLKIKYEVI